MLPTFTNDEIAAFLLALPIILLSVAAHEIAHGYSAYWLGDPTGRMVGRLSLNPLKNLDPFGTSMFAISWLVSGGTFIFGWSSYAPIQPRFFNDPPRAYALVSAAGPVTNLLLSFPFALVLVHASPSAGIVEKIIIDAFFINVVLFTINLIPLPFFDAWGIIGGLMPRELWGRWMNLRASMAGWGSLVLIAGLFYFSSAFGNLIGAIESSVAKGILTLAGG